MPRQRTEIVIPQALREEAHEWWLHLPDWPKAYFAIWDLLAMYGEHVRIRERMRAEEEAANHVPGRK